MLSKTNANSCLFFNVVDSQHMLMQQHKSQHLGINAVQQWIVGAITQKQ